jgi:hypothetical protein
MTARNRLNAALTLIALSAGLGVITAMWQTRQVEAFQDSEDRPSDFGFVDVGPGQTARLSVVNVRHSPPPERDNPPPERENPNLAQRVRLSFDIYVAPLPHPDLSSCAIRYRFLRRESCDVMLMPGEAASLDFMAAEDMKVAASINSLGGPDTREGHSQLTPEPHLAPTLEVRENSRTIFVVPGVAKGFNPQPDPPGTP